MVEFLHHGNPSLGPDFLNHAGQLVCRQGAANPQEAVHNLLTPHIRGNRDRQHNIDNLRRTFFRHAQEVVKLRRSESIEWRIFFLKDIQKSVSPQPVQPAFIGLVIEITASIQVYLKEFLKALFFQCCWWGICSHSFLPWLFYALLRRPAAH